MIKIYNPSLNGLGALSDSTTKAIRDNRQKIAKVLQKSKLQGLGSTKDILTIEESIEEFNSANMSEDEIRAWVFYKRSLGVPMTGWEKYFSKKQVQTQFLESIYGCKIRDKNNVFIRVVPNNTKLGTFIGEAYEGWYSFSDFNGELCFAPKEKVKIVNVTTSPQSEIDKMVNKGVLFYNKGRYLPLAVYIYYNLYDRELELKEDSEFIIEHYGERVYNDHKKILDKYKVKTLSFFDTTKVRRPFLDPLSDFAGSFMIYESENGSIHIGENGLSLRNAYNDWLWGLNDKKYYEYPNINGYTISRMCFENSKRPKGYDEEEWEYRKGLAFKELYRLFDVFIDEVVTVSEKTRLDVTWNRTFNGYPNLLVNKVPIGLNINKAIELRPAQREGVAFMELTNSGCIAYDVGVGKTFTAIAEVSCAMAQGRCKRPLIVVPNSTYQNWIAEIIGKNGRKGLLSDTGITINKWFNMGVDIAPKPKQIKDGTITLITKEGLKKFGFSNSLNEDFANDLVDILMQATPNSTPETKNKFILKVFNLLGLGQKGSIINFDECGFDYIVIDEAHNYRNLFTKIQPKSSKKAYHVSLGEPSDLAIKGFIFSNYVQRKFGGNVMLLTATPFTNSPLEVFSMLAYVGMDELRKRNIDNIHTFFETFINEEYDEIVNKSNIIVNDWVVKSFKNKIILQSILYSKFNYKTGEEAGVKRPTKINIPLINYDGKRLPSKNHILSYLKMTERQRRNQDIINFIVNDIEAGNMGKVLSGMGSSLDNALSPFLFKIKKELQHSIIYRSGLGVTAEEIAEINREPNDGEEFIQESPKIRFACECIKSVKEWHEKRGETCSGQIIYADRGKDYFDYIKEYLEDTCGFKRDLNFEYEDIDDPNGKVKKKKVDEVMIITSGVGDSKKNIIMNAFNAGVIKVIIGTSTIKEGVNLQTCSTCLYNLYPNWNPTDIQQLEGRIYRQGNKFQFVRIVLPLVQDSMDVFVFQKLNEKTDRINSLWYKDDRGNVLDIDSLDPREVRMSLITDILLLARIDIKHEVRKVERDKILIESDKDALSSFVYNLKRLKEYREYVTTEMKNAMSNVARSGAYSDYINNRPSEDDLSKMKAEERNKIKAYLEKYDDFCADMANIDSLDDEEFRNVALKMKRAGGLYIIYDSYYTNFVDYKNKVQKVENQVLIPRGLNRYSDISSVINDYKTEITKKNEELIRLNSQEHLEEVADEIAERRREANIIGKSVEDRINEFTNINYTMQYPFDPNISLKNNYIPNKNETKLSVLPPKKKEEKEEKPKSNNVKLLKLKVRVTRTKLRLLKYNVEKKK